MTAPTNPVTTPVTGPTAPAGGTNPVPNGSGSDPGYSMSTTVTSLAELQKVAPKVYNGMMQGIASGIISQMQDGQDKIHQMNILAEQDLEDELE